MRPHPDPVLCRSLADDLAAAGYHSEAVRAAWGATADDAVGRGLRNPAVRALGGRDDALAVLARTLMLGMPTAAASVDLALPRTGSAGLVALGLARLDGDIVVPTALVRPQSFADERGAGQWWVASDLDEAALDGPIAEDHVLGVGGASLTLAGLQLPTPAGRALDVGSGCGIQSLRARRDCAHVVATDISDRALRFTEMNALLNDVDGIETRRGSLFEPVAGERFDRIVSNPPFVITPRAEGIPSYEYRDGGMVGDDLVAAFVRHIGDHLEPGGVAQLLGNWETRDGVSGLDRVREWIRSNDIPLDAWIVEREAADPLAYAELWVRDGGIRPGSADHGRLIDAWLDDFSARRVTEIGFGYILLRRPATGAQVTLARYERLHHSLPSRALGSHLATGLRAHDRLASLDDVELSRTVFTVAGDVTEARHHLPGEADPSVIELRQGGGFGRVLAVDSAMAAVVGACDGDLPAGVLIDAVAHLLEVDPVALRADILPRLREFTLMGILEMS